MHLVAMFVGHRACERLHHGVSTLAGTRQCLLDSRGGLATADVVGDTRAGGRCTTTKQKQTAKNGGKDSCR